METAKCAVFARLTAVLPRRTSLKRRPSGTPRTSRTMSGSATSTTIRTCASRPASKTQSTRSHPPRTRRSNDRRVASASGDSCASQNRGSAAWVKPSSLSRQWQRKTTRATNLADATCAGQIALEARQMTFVKFASGATLTTNTKTGPSRTSRINRSHHQRCDTTRRRCCRARVTIRDQSEERVYRECCVV